MTLTDFDRFVWDLKRVVDRQVGDDVHTAGNLKIRFMTGWDSKNSKSYPSIVITNTEGDWVEVASSPGGKVLKVFTSTDKIPVKIQET